MKALEAVLDDNGYHLIGDLHNVDEEHKRLFKDIVSSNLFDNPSFLVISQLMPSWLVVRRLSDTPPLKKTVDMYVVSYSSYDAQLRNLLTPFVKYHEHVTNMDVAVEATFDFVLSRVLGRETNVWPALENHLQTAMDNYHSYRREFSSLGHLLENLESLFWIGVDGSQYVLHTVDVKLCVVNIAVNQKER